MLPHVQSLDLAATRCVGISFKLSSYSRAGLMPRIALKLGANADQVKSAAEKKLVFTTSILQGLSLSSSHYSRAISGTCSGRLCPIVGHNHRASQDGSGRAGSSGALDIPAGSSVAILRGSLRAKRSHQPDPLARGRTVRCRAGGSSNRSNLGASKGRRFLPARKLIR